MAVIRAFTLDQAASVARVSTRRASYWARTGVLEPSLIYDTSKRPYRYLYDFRDVVGLRTLGMLRDQHKLPLQQLRRAYNYLRQHADKPWSELRLWVRGRELFFSNPKGGQVISASSPGQITIAVELAPVARQVQSNADELAKRRPEDIGQTDRHRNIQGNRLVVKGTRIPVSTIVNLVADGYSASRIVKSYPSLTIEDVKAVLARHRGEHAA